MNRNSLVSCNVKITKQPLFCSVFWYVLFHKNLIVLPHGDNNFLLYFDIYIKFIISLIIYIKFIISLTILTMKKWPHLTWCVLFYDFFMKKKIFERKKIRHFKNESKFLELSHSSPNFKKQSFTDVFQNRCRSKVRNIHKKTVTLAVADLLLKNTYGGCFWILAAGNTFFSWIWYLLLTPTPVFAPNSFGKAS